MYFIRKNEKKFNTIWNKFRQNPDQFPSDNDLTTKFENPKEEKDDWLNSVESNLADVSKDTPKDKDKDNKDKNSTSTNISSSTKNSKLKDTNLSNTDKPKTSSGKDVKDELSGLHGINGLSNNESNAASEELNGVHNLGRFKQLDDGVMRVIN
jgi:hypothetical protein